MKLHPALDLVFRALNELLDAFLDQFDVFRYKLAAHPGHRQLSVAASLLAKFLYDNRSQLLEKFIAQLENTCADIPPPLPFQAMWQLLKEGGVVSSTEKVFMPDRKVRCSCHWRQ
jgi:hypothetical protein